MRSSPAHRAPLVSGAFGEDAVRTCFTSLSLSLSLSTYIYIYICIFLWLRPVVVGVSGLRVVDLGRGVERELLGIAARQDLHTLASQCPLMTQFPTSCEVPGAASDEQG